MTADTSPPIWDPALHLGFFPVCRTAGKPIEGREESDELSRDHKMREEEVEAQKLEEWEDES